MVPKATCRELSDSGFRSVLLRDFSLSYIRISRKVGRGTDWWLWLGRWGEADASLVRLDPAG